MLNSEILKKISQAEILNFGSGPSAYAFDYEAAGINGMNLAMTPSAFMMELAFLNEYRDTFTAAAQKSGGCTVVLTVCPFSFGDNRTKGDAGRYMRYYNILSRESFDRLPPPLAHWNPQVAERADPNEPLFPYAAKCHPDEIPSSDVMSARTDAMCDCWKQEFGLHDFMDAGQAEAHKAAFLRERLALEKLIDCCKSLGLCPYLMLPPLHPLLRSRISDAFFTAFVREQIKDIPVPLLDYTDSPLITESMFYGPVFLNRSGAAFLTDLVYKTIKTDKQH